MHISQIRSNLFLTLKSNPGGMLDPFWAVVLG